MENFKTICILGRQPDLGIAELESLYGAEHLQPLRDAALLDIAAEEINFKRLGGTIKVGRILSVLPDTDWRPIASYLLDSVPAHAEKLEPGKLTLGISVYGLDVKVEAINKALLTLKKAIKSSGRPVRVLQNKTPELNSAAVLHNKLTHRGAWELLLVKNGSHTILAQTLFVQDIEAYAGRDQARPRRDSRVGMLPPKLAQTIINLTNTTAGGCILDPFCGTGVVLQEALLMGYNVIGTDLEPRMVDYTNENLDWLKGCYPALEAKPTVEVGDATNYQWHNFDSVVSEVYLGRPFSTVPSETDLKQAAADANTIIKKFLANLAAQLKPGQKLCLAVPAWRKPNGSFLHLPLLDHLTEMGYNYWDFKHVPRTRLIYFREGQFVARQLIRLEKI